MADPDADDLGPFLQPFYVERVRQLAKKAVSRMTRIKASGIQGGDYDLKSLWSEYCWEIQNGDVHLGLVEDVVSDIVHAIVGALPPDEAALLDQLGHRYPPDERWPETLHGAVMERLTDTAAMRNLDRYDPDYRWYENL